MAQSPTLLFCVGATKAGTSWLYSYFAGHPAFYLRSVKELHYFYAHETEASWPLTWLKNHIAEFREDIPGTSAERAAYRTVRLRDCRELAKLLRNPLDEEAYVAYLTRWRANQAVVGVFLHHTGCSAPSVCVQWRGFCPMCGFCLSCAILLPGFGAMFA